MRCSTAVRALLSAPPFDGCDFFSQNCVKVGSTENPYVARLRFGDKLGTQLPMYAKFRLNFDAAFEER
jgi:hypothetical protein